MIKKWLCYLSVCCLSATVFLSGCKPGAPAAGGDITSQGTVGDDLESDFPAIELKDKTIRLMNTNTEISKRQEELLMEQYGAKVEFITTSWEDMPVRLSSLVMSGESPDLVVNRSSLDDFPSYVVNSLVQPIDEYIRLDHKLFRDLKDAYDASQWGGKHYLLISHLGHEMGVMFNPKLFEDYDLENPWELYQKGTWDWNTFRQAAKELTEDENRDGTPERYGFQFTNAAAFYYSTGKSQGSIDGNNKSIVHNLKDPDIARAMNFVSDLLSKDKVCSNTISSAITDFKNQKCAMLYGSAYPYVGPELRDMAEQGLLGFAPLPKDPQADDYYAIGQFAGYFIPKGAPNPYGAVAFCAVDRYLQTTLKQEVDDEEWVKYKAENKLSDLNREQLAACGKMKMVPELGAWIDQGITYNLVGDRGSWAAELETYLPKIEARIDEVMTVQEYDAPTGPKVIDNFETYGDDTGTPLRKYIAMDGGDRDITVTLDNGNAQGDGKYAAKFTYKLSENLWGGIYRNINQTWKSNDTLRFWIKGDGSKQTVGLRFDTANGGVWGKNVEINSAEGQVLEIPFSDFEDSYATGLEMDLTKVTKFYISFGELSPATKTIYLDNIEVIKK